MAITMAFSSPLLMTPPMSSHMKMGSTTTARTTTTTTTTTVLPPISHFDASPALFANAHRPIDWLDFARLRSARFIAEKTCEMICYLWFGSTTTKTAVANQLQLQVTPTFITFLQKLLETTQVSQSVIVLSLHYIYRLKERNRWTPAQEGSEFRIAVAGLMMANKFLDDNTYTNKTWSEVSGISLVEINRMEREFLMGVDFDLYVSKPTYESWLNLLKGLVWAKERDSKRLRKRRVATTNTATTPSSSAKRRHAIVPRARSTSPHHHPQQHQIQQHPSPSKSGNKRTAATAFSPTSATYSSVPSKRPVSMILSIPETRFPSAYSPLEVDLTKLTIIDSSSSSSSNDSPIDPSPLVRHRHERGGHVRIGENLGDRVLPEERVRMMETARAPPGRLYFWTAASRTPPQPVPTPPPSNRMETDDEEDDDEEEEEQVVHKIAGPKARLRYSSQPTQEQQQQQQYPAPPPPIFTYPPTTTAHQLPSNTTNAFLTPSAPFTYAPTTTHYHHPVSAQSSPLGWGHHHHHLPQHHSVFSEERKLPPLDFHSYPYPLHHQHQFGGYERRSTPPSEQVRKLEEMVERFGERRW